MNLPSRRTVFLSDLGVICANGSGKDTVSRNLLSGSINGMRERTDLLVDGSPIIVGEVTEYLPEVPSDLDNYRSRNLRLIISAVDQILPKINAALDKFGASRVAVIMGTSTSGIAEGEVAVKDAVKSGRLPKGYDIRRQEIGSVGESLARYLGAKGVAYTISTACSSSALALAVARRLLITGLADAVVTGGADSLCQLTVNGFNSLSALSGKRCNPMSINRDGTSIGEGAAVFLMTREESEIALFGTGDSIDGYSMTGPNPEGEGVERGIREALKDAGLACKDIDYIQLHGTGTEQNDIMESKVVLRMFGDQTPASSSKGQVGHTLGAAGALGAAHCWLALRGYNEEYTLPPHVWDGQAEPGLLSESLVRVGQTLPVSSRGIALSNAFAFGGSNASLILGRSG